MKYEVGDIVKIKSQKWYDENKDFDGNIRCDMVFVYEMAKYLGKTATIQKVRERSYILDIDKGEWLWSDDMFEDKILNKDAKDIERRFDDLIVHCESMLKEIKQIKMRMDVIA